MEGNVERECSALGGLFQQIISDMKVSRANYRKMFYVNNVYYDTLIAFVNCVQCRAWSLAVCTLLFVCPHMS